MAKSTRTYTVLSCDFCGGDGDDVLTRRFTIDDKRRQLEACEECWEGATKDLLAQARQVRRS